MMDDAIRLLAGVLAWPEKRITEVCVLRDRYKVITKIKKDGSRRTIHEPNPALKEFQKRLLRYFLYRIPLDYYGIIKGCRPKSSHISNTRWHSDKNTNFVLRLDLQDAFPSVKTGYLGYILRKIFLEEIENYKKGRIEHYKANPWQDTPPPVKMELLRFRVFPLFSIKKVPWFRKLFKDSIQLNLFYSSAEDTAKEILENFTELIISLDTHKGNLPQGAPASPYLLNIVLYYSGLIEKIYRLLWDNEIFVSEGAASKVLFSVYVDDFTISSSKPIPKSVIDKIIRIIEQESPFKVNKNKTLYYKRDRIAPLITGLRLVALKKSKEELEKELKKRGYTPRELKNLKRRLLNEKGEWHVEAVVLPKKQIRKIRGLIHAAATDPQLRSELAPQITGYVASLKAVYGNELPRQIKIPYEKYLKSLEV